MGITLLKKQSYRVTPWKNGAGFTSEIAIFPLDLNFSRDPFIWRLSSAEISESGPFSTFPGYDRYLTMIEGRGVRVAGQTLTAGKVIRFSGDEEFSAELIAGPVTDLGLIFKRDSVKADFNLTEFNGKPRSFRKDESTVLIHAIAGAVSVEAFPGGKTQIIKEGDTLFVAPTIEMILLEPSAPGTQLAMIEISPIHRR